MPNISPWIVQLKRDHPSKTLTENQKTQIAIIGGGIAGISTVYFILKNTNKKVILLESDKIAHGATGHNAGQVVSYFERQISDLVKEFGLEMTAEAQKAIDSAWLLIENIYTETHLKTPLSQFMGYAGCQDLAEIILHLENNWYSKEANINMEPIIIAEHLAIANQIPAKYDGLYSLLPHKDILSILETDDKRYMAVLSARKGCMNSALFCEELLEYILKTYPDRFDFFEGSHVSEVSLHAHHATLHVNEKEVLADRVVLCTNGFEKFTIKNEGDDIDTYFHHLVRGSVGYMAGYLEEHSMSPTAISFLPSRSNTGNEAFDEDPYFYLTRRTFEKEKNQQHSLICVGGPEILMDDTNQYLKEHPYSDVAQKAIDTFLHKTYKHAPKGKIDYTYRWHGLMGYTPNGVRCIGPEPINPVLMYNLGCNGVGILPSIYGGKKISQFINKEALEKSIFDPLDSRLKKIKTPKAPHPFSFLQKLLGYIKRT